MHRPMAFFTLMATLASPVAARTSLATGSAPEIPWLRLLLSFLLCIGIAAAAILLLRRYQKRSGNGIIARLRSANDRASSAQISIIEARRVGASAQLCLVEFDKRQLLLAVTDRNISILAEKQAGGETDEGGNSP